MIIILNEDGDVLAEVSGKEDIADALSKLPDGEYSIIFDN